VKIILGALIFFCGHNVYGQDAALQQSAPQPRWTVNLAQSYGHRNANVMDERQWSRQQGVRFITSSEIVAYQVNETRAYAPLASKGRTGGAGNFFLVGAILDARDGHELGRFRLPTNASLSGVFPTNGGKFIVRTGDVFFLYSDSFKELASKDLPLGGKASSEDWQIAVSPSGAKIFLAHRESVRNGAGEEVDSRVEVEVLNADTLVVQSTFRVPRLERWSAGEDFVVAENPKGGRYGRNLGLMDLSGKWRRVQTFLESDNPFACPYSMRALNDQLVAAIGCHGLLALTTSGKTVLSKSVPTGVYVASVAASGDFLAANSLRFQSDYLGFRTAALGIDVYDLAANTASESGDAQNGGDSKKSPSGRAPLLAIPTQGNNAYYDVSSKGDLAVLEGEELKLYSLNVQGTKSGRSNLLSARTDD